MMRYYSAMLSIILVAVFAGLVQGYEVVDVNNGATLKGTVQFKGTVPPDEANVIDKDVDYCGKGEKVGKYVVSDSKVKNAMVWLEGVTKGKAIPKSSVAVAIKNCNALPHVSAGFVGGKYVFKNEDDIMHTVQLKLGLAYHKQVSQRPLKDGATIYNLALPIKGMQIKKPIKKYHRYTKETGFIQIKSNTHNWIRGYIFIFDHPYAVVTNENGAFKMDNIVSGEYLLKIWHEGFGMQERKVRFAEGQLVEADIEFGK
ncbi:MAG: hypothetical protein BMS9Abin03_156 [Thermodesulfobacteriota bacterium]|nr:MAG: hypothetical protein BMS9Abin03_156 [Thermodesulfobacteriota bacterium]